MNKNRYIPDIWFEEDEPKSIWKRIGEVLLIVAFIVILWGIMVVANAYEEHKLCMNGAVEHCIPADFE
jgi:hypothetical protein